MVVEYYFRLIDYEYYYIVATYNLTDFVSQHSMLLQIYENIDGIFYCERLKLYEVNKEKTNNASLNLSSHD